MYSLAYGTIPIVRSVGGLKDTVIDHRFGEHATGFVFNDPTPQALLECVRRALLFYHEYPQALLSMRQRGMQRRFTWEDAANHYVEVYASANTSRV
jgi:starch synthase